MHTEAIEFRLHAAGLASLGHATIDESNGMSIRKRVHSLMENRRKAGKSGLSKWVSLGSRVFLLSAVALCAVADNVTDLTDQLYFQWVPRADKTVATCGYSLRGNHFSHKDPKVEWDVNVDEIIQGDERIVGVAAGTFDVVGGKRKPRAVITDLVFSFGGSSESIAAQLVGSPNRDNGVRGIIRMDLAPTLFDALSGHNYIVMSFKYADGTSDAIRINGFRDPNAGSHMTEFSRCLHGNPPAIRGNLTPIP